jgi:hypothetical protein
VITVQTGWYRRYRQEYARQRAEGATHENARKAAIRMLRAENTRQDAPSGETEG